MQISIYHILAGNVNAIGLPDCVKDLAVVVQDDSVGKDGEAFRMRTIQQ